MRVGGLFAVAGALASLYDVSCADGQVRASEAATVSQTVDGTIVSVAYSRPQARGRIGVFGNVVHHGEIWTPGANWATTLEVSKDVTISGAVVAEGKYSVWMIPGSDEWTVILDPDAKRFHTQRPKQSDAQIRLTVRPDSTTHTEVLTWAFPAVRRDGTTLQMRWGTTAVALEVAVEPTGRGRLAGSADAYVGTYRMRMLGPQGESPERSVVVYEKDSVLYLRIDPPPFPEIDPDIVLQKADTHGFTPAFQKDGRIFDVESDMKLVFTVENGSAKAIELQGLAGQIMAKGVRAQ